MASCIWCLGSTSDKDLEHIFPASLGCPDHMTLPGSVVCRACNSGLAHLDQAVADEFDFMAFTKGIPRKHGRPPEISSRGNVYGWVSEDGPQLHFNSERHAVTTSDGRRLARFKGAKRDVKLKTEHEGNQYKASFELPFGQGPKFVRGIYKTVFNCFTFLAGPELGRDLRFQEVRDFVRVGQGSRHLILTFDPDEKFTLAAYRPWISEDGFYIMSIRIGQIHFLADLSPGEVLFPQLQAKQLELRGPDGWTTLPT